MHIIYVYTWICAHVTLDTENRQRIFQVDYDDQRSHQQLLFFLKSPHLVLSVFSFLFMLVTYAAVLLWSNSVLSWWLLVNAALPMTYFAQPHWGHGFPRHYFYLWEGFLCSLFVRYSEQGCLCPLVYLFRPPRAFWITDVLKPKTNQSLIVLWWLVLFHNA